MSSISATASSSGLVVQPIKLELGLSDTQISLASGLLYVLFNLGGGLFIARFVDRGNRSDLAAGAQAVPGHRSYGSCTGFRTLFWRGSLSVSVRQLLFFPAAMSLIPTCFASKFAQGGGIPG